MRVLVVASAEATAVRWADAAHPVHLPADLADALVDAGHDARVARLPDPEDEGPPQPHAYASAAACGQWLTECLPGDDPVVLHAVDAAAAMACLAARSATGVPVVARWGLLPEPVGATERRLRLALLRAADVVVATTDASARQARAGGAERVAVVGDGIDTATVGPAARPRPEGDGYRIVTLSGPDAAGGTLCLVAALQQVPDAELVVAGRAADDDAPRRLRAAADAAGVGDRVSWLGWLPREQALDLMTDADVVVCPRGAATSAASAREAMCRARPVVGVRHPALADVVEDGTTGVLVPPGDPAALASALRSLLSNPFRREALAQAGADRVAAVYDWSRITARLAAVYDDALAAAPHAIARPSTTSGPTGSASVAIA